MNASAPASTSLAAPVTAPALWYRDPSYWPRERSEIFARSWQYIGHESQLAEPGQWVADEIAGFPLLVVRGGDGALNAFHNVCRHRAGPLTDGHEGKCDGLLRCKYHGWSYTLDGRLRMAREFGAKSGFDAREYGLFPVRVETWRGTVWVAVDPGIAPFAEWIAPVEALIKDQDWSDLKVSLRRHHPIKCNWKTYVENYLEGYHVPDVHPSLNAEVDASRYVVTMEGKVAIHEVPMRIEQPVYGGLWAWMWPNLGINIYQKGLMLERMSPEGASGTRLDYIYLMPDGEAVSDETLAMSDAVTSEDIWIVEKVQQNLNAGVYDVGRLSPLHEGAIAAFQSWVRDALGE